MTFLRAPAPSEGQQKIYAADLADDGFVWDLSRVWAHDPALDDRLGDLIVAAGDSAGLSAREKAVVVLAQAREIGDACCAYAWARRLTGWTDAKTAVAALSGDEGPFTERERALIAWARLVARDPNRTTPDDVRRLREAGFSEPQILALTVYAALRVAFSSANDALGAHVGPQLAETLEPSVRAAITWGRGPDA